MQTRRNTTTVVTLTKENAKRIKQVAKAIKRTPDFIVNDLFQKIDLVVVVKPKEYQL